MIVTAGALAVRLIYLAEMSSGPFDDVLYLDALRYDVWARSIVFGEEAVIEPFFRAPLYPLFLALFYKVFGHDLSIIRFVQMLIGSATTVLIYLTAEVVFDRKTALLSAVIWIFYGPAVYWAGEILIVTFIVFLDLSALYILVTNSSRSVWWKWLAAGVLIGLSAIARPTILVFAPFVLVWILLQKRDSRTGEKSPALAGALLFIFGLALPIAPVTITNFVDSGDFILISSQGGINFFMGNNPQADGKTAASPERGGIYGDYLDNAWVSSVRIAEKEEGRPLEPSEVSRFWFREGLRYIADRPLEWMKLMLDKLGYFWSGTEVTNNEDTYYFRQFSTVLSLLMWQNVISFPFGLVSPLALLGMIVAWRQRSGISVLSAFVLLYMTGVVLFFVCGRYRMPVIPVLVMFSSFSLVWLAGAIRMRNWSRVVPAVTGLLLLGAAANSDFGSVNRRNRAQARYLTGWAYHQEGQFDLALAQYEAANRYFPRHLQVQNNRGLIHAERGEFERAIEAFRKAVDINPADPMPRFYLATAYLSAGRLREAAETYEQVLALDPGNPLAAYRAGAAYAEIGDREKAIELLSLCLRIDPTNRRARAALEELENLQRE